MNARWLAVPALLALAGCKDPAATYRNAAKQLTFTLEQVEPNVQLAYPLEQSRLDLRLTVNADNPTAVRFKARSIRGDISLDTDGANHFVGQMGVAKGVDLLAAQGRSAQEPVQEPTQEPNQYAGAEESVGSDEPTDPAAPTV